VKFPQAVHKILG